MRASCVSRKDNTTSVSPHHAPVYALVLKRSSELCIMQTSTDDVDSWCASIAGIMRVHLLLRAPGPGIVREHKQLVKVLRAGRPDYTWHDKDSTFTLLYRQTLALKAVELAVSGKAKQAMDSLSLMVHAWSDEYRSQNRPDVRGTFNGTFTGLCTDTNGLCAHFGAISV